MDFLLASTHKEVQEYLSGIDFSNSLGATLYDEHYENELVTEEQAVDYIFNTHRIFQVQGVIMKPINEVNEEVRWEFLLTMVDSYLDNGTYEYLIADYYDENTMNKFATNPDDDNFELFEFIQATPTGYEETEPNDTIASKPPFWGFGIGSCLKGTRYLTSENNCIVERCKKRKYIFWIPVGEVIDEPSGVEPTCS